jgi:serine/threonine protein kinase
VTDFPRDGLIRLIDAPELPFRAHTRDIVKADRCAVVVRAEMPVGGRMQSVAYKQVRRRGLWKRLTGLLGGNRTLRAWRMGHRLAALGVTTSRPVAVVVPPWIRPGRPSYLTTEWVAGANLTQFADGLERLEPRRRQRRLHAAAAALGELLGRMHAAGVSHRDLKAGNLFLVRDEGHGRKGRGARDEGREDSESLRAVVIDLDGAAVWPWVPMWLRVRNLGRFAFACETSFPLSHSVRRRFLAAYLRAAGRPAGEWKSLWARVGRRSRSVARRKRHPCRPATGASPGID